MEENPGRGDYRAPDLGASGANLSIHFPVFSFFHWDFSWIPISLFFFVGIHFSWIAFENLLWIAGAGLRGRESGIYNVIECITYYVLFCCMLCNVMLYRESGGCRVWGAGSSLVLQPARVFL